jgi:hypothetical protein
VDVTPDPRSALLREYYVSSIREQHVEALGLAPLSQCWEDATRVSAARSFAFEHGGLRAIVVVNNQGRVILAIYP